MLLESVSGQLAIKLEEIEQLQFWAEEIAGPAIEGGEDIRTALHAAALSFEETLEPLRPLLDDPVRRGEVWRAVAEARSELRPG